MRACTGAYLNGVGVDDDGAREFGACRLDIDDCDVGDGVRQEGNSGGQACRTGTDNEDVCGVWEGQVGRDVAGCWAPNASAPVWVGGERCGRAGTWLGAGAQT